MKKSDKLIKLQAEWYAKLKESGFEDQERFTKAMEPKLALKQESRTQASYHAHQAAEVEQYFIDCRAHLFSNAFRNENERAIWELYSEGESIQKIAKELSLPFELTRVVVKYHRETYILPLYKPEVDGVIELKRRRMNEQDK